MKQSGGESVIFEEYFVDVYWLAFPPSVNFVNIFFTEYLYTVKTKYKDSLYFGFNNDGLLNVLFWRWYSRHKNFKQKRILLPAPNIIKGIFTHFIRMGGPL